MQFKLALIALISSMALAVAAPSPVNKNLVAKDNIHQRTPTTDGQTWGRDDIHHESHAKTPNGAKWGRDTGHHEAPKGQSWGRSTKDQDGDALDKRIVIQCKYGKTCCCPNAPGCFKCTVVGGCNFTCP